MVTRTLKNSSSYRGVRVYWYFSNLVYSRVRIRACLHEGGGPQVGEVTCGWLHHLTCKRDHIKMRDCMDRRVTPSKRVTSLTWGPLPPCKQALRRTSSESVPRLCIFMIILGSDCQIGDLKTNLKTNCCSVSFSVLPRTHQEELMG